MSVGAWDQGLGTLDNVIADLYWLICQLTAAGHGYICTRLAQYIKGLMVLSKGEEKDFFFFYMFRYLDTSM